MKNPFAALGRLLRPKAKKKPLVRKNINELTETERQQGHQLGYNGESIDPVLNEFDIRANVNEEKLTRDSAREIEKLEPQVEQDKKAIEVFKKNFDLNVKQTKEGLTSKNSKNKTRKEAAISKEKHRTSRRDVELGEISSQQAKKPHLKGRTPTFYERKVVLIILECLLITLDAPLGWQAVEYFFNVTPIVAMLGGIAVSVFLGLCALFVGIKLDQKRVIAVIVWLSLLLLLIAILTYTRFASNDDNAILVAPFLIVMTFITALVSKEYHKNGTYFENEKRKKSLQEKNAKSIERVIDLKADMKALEDQVLGEAKASVNKDLKAKTTRFKNSTKALNDARKEYDEMLKDAISFRKNGKRVILQAYEEGKREAAKNSQARNSFQDEAKTSKSSSNLNGSVATSILALVLFSLVGCRGDTVEIVHFRDVSKSAAHDSAVDCEALKNAIIKDSNFDTSGFSNQGVRIQFSRLDFKSVPNTIECFLPSSDHWLIAKRKDRANDTKAMISEFEIALLNHCNEVATANNTQIYRPVMHVASSFSSENRRIVYIDSDFIAENTLLNLAENRYVREPNLIMDDYDSLVTRLYNDTRPNDLLKGVEMIFLVDVLESKENLTTMAARFFQRYFEEKCGAKVRYQANL